MSKQPEFEQVPKKRGRPLLGKAPLSASARAARSRKKSCRKRIEFTLSADILEELDKLRQDTCNLSRSDYMESVVKNFLYYNG